jgi:hypothetical protein
MHFEVASDRLLAVCKWRVLAARGALIGFLLSDLASAVMTQAGMLAQAAPPAGGPAQVTPPPNSAEAAIAQRVANSAKRRRPRRKRAA